jgi:hypothetical protein
LRYPETRVTTRLCGWPDLNVKAEVTDASGELGTGWITAGEVIHAEILVAGAVGQHVVGGGEDRRRHGNRSFFGPAPCLEPKELSLKVAVFLAGCSSGTLNEDGLQPWGAFSNARRTSLAGTLVEARNKTRPGQEMTRRPKLPHVGADLGEEELGGALAQTRNLFQSFKGATKGRERGLVRQRALQTLHPKAGALDVQLISAHSNGFGDAQAVPVDHHYQYVVPDAVPPFLGGLE